ncbi:MAG: hypothetical protein A2W20_09130 [Candidatus Aminicenantes bacterium RBG_16_66_30]|nr:MAG: hypothetical protein A2W20_09130 [Candidatus Aminicenantes bacterium RBG_16_66_30]
MAVLINIVLAAATLYFYVVASRRFYRREEPFMARLGIAVLLDIATAFTASFKLTPTTQLPGPHNVPWDSVLFLTHMAAASLGMFGFIAVFLILVIKGKDRPYDKMRRFQYRVLLPAWAIGEVIALTNSILKIVLKVRIYDYF